MLIAKNDILMDGMFIVEGDHFEADPEQKNELIRLGWAEEVEKKPQKATKKK